MRRKSHGENEGEEKEEEKEEEEEEEKEEEEEDPPRVCQMSSPQLPCATSKRLSTRQVGFRFPTTSSKLLRTWSPAWCLALN